MKTCPSCHKSKTSTEVKQKNKKSIISTKITSILTKPFLKLSKKSTL